MDAAALVGGETKRSRTIAALISEAFDGEADDRVVAHELWREIPRRASHSWMGGGR